MTKDILSNSFKLLELQIAARNCRGTEVQRENEQQGKWILQTLLFILFFTTPPNQLALHTIYHNRELNWAGRKTFGGHSGASQSM